MKLHRLLPLLVLAACAEDPVAVDLVPGDVVMTSWIDQSAASPAPNVRIYVRNESRHTVYVADYCGDALVPRLERRQGEQWVPADGGLGGCLAVATPPIELSPGETVSRWIALHDAGQYRSTVRVTPGSIEKIVQVQTEFTVNP